MYWTLRRNGFPSQGTDEYLSNYWTHAERDLGGALRQRDMGAAEYVRQLKALAADYSTEDLLSRITANTLVIHGRQDRIVEEDEVRFLADGIAGAGLAMIEEAGHCSPIEQPQAFTAVLRGG
jgi:pimeloyl-ACP methyl ester carboxylesterase